MTGQERGRKWGEVPGASLPSGRSGMGVCRPVVGRGGVGVKLEHPFTRTPPRHGRNRKEKGQACAGHGRGGSGGRVPF